MASSPTGLFPTDHSPPLDLLGSPAMPRVTDLPVYGDLYVAPGGGGVITGTADVVSGLMDAPEEETFGSDLRDLLRGSSAAPSVVVDLTVEEDTFAGSDLGDLLLTKGVLAVDFTPGDTPAAGRVEDNFAACGLFGMTDLLLTGMTGLEGISFAGLLFGAGFGEYLTVVDMMGFGGFCPERRAGGPGGRIPCDCGTREDAGFCNFFCAGTTGLARPCVSSFGVNVRLEPRTLPFCGAGGLDEGILVCGRLVSGI